jgi:hypothetical protein
MIANEMKVDLDVFDALMLDGVRAHVDDTNIVIEHNHIRRRWSMKLVEEWTNPTILGDSVSHNMVLNLSARMRDRVLLL